MRELVADCLRRLGRDPATLGPVTPLAGSASGSLVALVRLGDEELVLKRTSRREATLYRASARLPVRTPRVVAADDTCLLLEALAPLPAAAAWPHELWAEVARQLGALHGPEVAAAFGDATWLRQPAPARQPDAAARAFWSTDELALLDRPDATLPTCLVHGDVHAGNLLRAADGGLVWTDWQEVGLGQGPEDLALLWQRAEVDGADPPRTAMLATYAAARGIPCDETLIRATAAAEIRLLLLDWPAHLTAADPDRRARVRRRLRSVARLV